MGARRAELETRITGADASISALGGLERALDKVGQTGQRTAARIRDLKAEWDKPTSAGAAFAKLGAQVLGQQLSAAADAVTGPAKSSYAQAVARAYEYRDTTQRIATSAGQSYERIGEQILGTSKRLGILPGRVADYGRSVRSLTGDWAGAMSGVEAYQSRALKTDRTLEDMIPTAATLAQTFGVKSTEDVNRFFGTLDRQAKSAGVSAEVAERAFMSASASLSMLTSAKPEQISALTTQVMGNAPNAAVGEANLGEIGGFIQRHQRYIEARMRQQGKLGKGEHLYDAQGMMRADKFFDVLEFAQGDIRKVYGGRDKMETMGRIYQSGEMSLTGAAALQNLDVAKMREAAKARGGSASMALDQWLSTAAGQREAAEAQKERRDIGLGSTMLPAQDLAVRTGGGAAGVALASSSQVFSKATDTFWHAVDIFAGKAGRAGGAAGVVESATGTTAGNLLSKVGGGVLGAAALPVALMGAVGYYGYKDIAGQAGDYEAARERDKADKAASATLGMDVVTMRRLRSKGVIPTSEAPLPMYEPAPGSAPRGGAAPVPNVQAEADTHAAALMKQLESKPLRVLVIQPASAPPGQGQPL